MLESSTADMASPGVRRGIATLSHPPLFSQPGLILDILIKLVPIMRND
jgi:hypothetical protein